MRKKSLTISLFILILSLVVISAFPSYPCAFYGEVSYNNSAIEDGYFLTAKINGVISGVDEIKDGKYGYDSNFIVLSTEQNALIEFYVSDLKVGEADFEDKSITKLDFELTELPIKTESPVDGICDVEEGECTKNAIDCNPEIVDACVGNGRCDIEIGEDCSNAEEDCGVCEYCGDGICNNEETCSTCPEDCGACSSGENSGGGSSGGGGGGGISSSSASTTLSTNNSDLNKTNNSDLNLTIQTYEQEEQESEENEEVKNSKITGGFIGTTEGKIGLAAIIIVGVIILSYFGIFLKRKFRK